MNTHRYIMLVVLLLFTGSLVSPARNAHAQTSGYAFYGRRGTLYNATWDESTYEIEIATPDNTFPWDFISFVSPLGAVALNGLPNIGNTFAFSDNSSIAGAMPGDILRVKGHDAWVLSHLGKIGLVIGQGTNAQRAWFSQGTISAYLLEPGSVGYRVTVLGRQATVRITQLQVSSLEFVTIFAITLDDTTNARLIFATDLEPAISYTYGVEYHDTPDTAVAYNATTEVITGTARMDGGDELAYWARTNERIRAYLYASTPLESWSASNLPLDDYLQTDTLDEGIASGYTDGRVALSMQAQPTQYIYLGNTVLSEPVRSDPIVPWEALRAERLSTLQQLPIMQADTLPGLELTSMLANLLNSYIINPEGRVYAADRTFLYAPDSLIPLNTYPEMLPPAWQSTYRDLLERFSTQAYPSPPVNGTDMYWWKLDLGGPSPLPSWYGGNIPDLPIYLPDGLIYNRRQFSDVHSTTEYLRAMLAYYRISGDASFVQAHEAVIDGAIDALKQFDVAYDAAYGEDGNLFPNVMMSVADLSTLDGEYPAESAAATYAYEAAADLLDILGRHADATDLRDNYAAPMRAAFEAAFWDPAENFYMPYADQNNGDGKADGQQYDDKWSNNLFFTLQGDIGEAHKAAILSTYTAPGIFFESEGDVHWMSTDSEHFMDHGGYGISPSYNNGYIMEGGFFSMLPAFAPIGYYQMGESALGDQYANIFLQRWLELGPYETMMEYNGQVPGRMLESSMYIEGTAMPAWLIREALGMQVEGNTIRFNPKLEGAFNIRNLYLTVQGQHALLDYRRSASGCETFEIRENTGLTLTSDTFTTVTWQGGASGDWNDPANWGGTLPDCNTHVVIPAGSHVTLTGDAQAQNLTISEGAILDLNSHTLSAEGAVQNRGELRQTRTVDASCTTGEGCALGFVRTQDGVSTRHYGVYLRPTGSNPDMGAVGVSLRGAQTCGTAGTLNNTVQRCFEITPATPQPAEITFYYRADEANANAAPVAWHYLGNGLWEQENLSGSGATGDWRWVAASGVDAYSPFALADAQPTALKLTAFHASTSSKALLPVVLLVVLLAAVWRIRRC